GVAGGGWGDGGGGGLRGRDRLARLPVRHRGGLFRAAHHRVRGVYPDRFRPPELYGRRCRAVPAVRRKTHGRVVEPARRATAVLLSGARARVGRCSPGRTDRTLAARLSMARGARGRNRGAPAWPRPVCRQTAG